MSKKLRVLLIAEAANPEWPSVPLVGWSLSRALAKLTNAHLVTHVRNRDAISRSGMVEGRDFTTIDNEYVASPLYKLSELLRGGAGKGWTTVTAFSSLAYYFFEYELWRQFGSRISAHEFDLVHRITPLSPTSQSLLAKRVDRHRVPFVIGPLNGGIPWPKYFMGRQHAEREWLSHIRSLYKLMPYYRSTLKHTTAIIAGSKYTLSQFPRWARHKSVYVPENGVDLNRIGIHRTRTARLPLKGAFVGRLVPYKGADMLLDSTAEYLKQGHLELHIIGDGPQRELLEAMVDRLDIRKRVHFYGWIAHSDVQKTLSDCDFMALPSIREFGGAVVVESMALGVAPIVANYGGPSELVDDTTGIRVSFSDKQSLVEGMRRAIGKGIQLPKILDSLGAAGRIKVLKKLTWDAKASQIVAIYNAVLSGAKNLSSHDFYGP